MFTGWGLRASGLAATGCVAAFAFPAQAQDDTAALRAEIEALKKTITTLETRLEAVERKEEETPAATASASASPPISTAAPQQFAVRQPDVLRSPLPPRDTVGDELTGVARPDTRPPPNDPDLKGFLLIPGTDTMLRLGGFAKVNAIYDTAPAGNADKLVTSTIPVGAGGADNANIDANATRFSFEVRRPSILGPLRFYLENDFYGGSGSTAFRLRQATARSAISTAAMATAPSPTPTPFRTPSTTRVPAVRRSCGWRLSATSGKWGRAPPPRSRSKTRPRT